MRKITIGFILMLGLSACGEYEGRKTNCWSAAGSGGSSDVVTRNCTDWMAIGG